MKSSVKVPVLSKQACLTLPPEIILFGEIQKIYLALSFSMAKIIPNVMLTGNPGGTVMVIKSKNLRTISSAATTLWIMMIRTQ